VRPPLGRLYQSRGLFFSQWTYYRVVGKVQRRGNSAKSLVRITDQFVQVCAMSKPYGLSQDLSVASYDRVLSIAVQGERLILIDNETAVESPVLFSRVSSDSALLLNSSRLNPE
jgi:hypothetical protein